MVLTDIEIFSHYCDMLVFVDESGDPGMKLEAGSSAVFVVTAVLFEDHKEATACDRRIDHIRREVGFSEHREFRFNKCSRPIREHSLVTHPRQ